MGHAKHIGRVGGLAVALGVGVAVATTPGIAWADETGSPPPSDSSPASPGSTTSGSGTEVAGTGYNTTTTSNTTTSGASTGEGTSTPKVVYDSSGGAPTSINDEGADSDDPPATSTPEPTDKPGEKSSTSTPKKRKKTSLTVATPTATGDDAGTAVANPKRTQSLNPPESTTEQQSVERLAVASNTSMPSTGLPPSVEVLQQALPQDASALAPDSASFASKLLSWVGLGLPTSGAGGDLPQLPGESPLLLAGLAVLRRQTQQSLVGDDAATLTVTDPSQSSLVLAELATPTYELDSSISVGSGPTGLAVTPDGGHVYVADRFTKSVYVIDTSTRTTVATIPMGAGPNAVAVSPDGKLAYVGLHGVNQVAVIDTATNTVVRKVDVGPGATEIVVTPDGSRAYVTNTSGRTVSVIDTATNIEIARVAVGSSPMGLAVTPDGNHVYVANRYSNSVSVISTATNKVVATVKVGSSPRSVAISPDGSHAYVTNAGPNTVSVIDTATNTVVATVGVGSDPIGVAMSPDGTLVYAANSNDTVSVIDTATNTVVDTFAVDPKPETGVHYIAVGPDGTVYVTDTRDKALRIVTATAPAPVAQTTMRMFLAEDGSADEPVMLMAAALAENSAPTVPVQPTGIPDPATGVVSGNVVASDGDGNPLSYSVTGTSANGGTVSINPTTGAYTYTPTPAARLAAGATAGADVDTFTVSVFDGQTTTTGTVPVYVSPLVPSMAISTPVQRDPTGVAVYGNRAYVINQYDKSVSVIDTNPSSPTYNMVVSTIKLASGPNDIVLNSTGTRAYVATKGNASVAVIDTTTNTVITNVRVGSTPTGIAISPDDSRVYVTNGGSSTVSVIDTALNKETSRITVGSQPSGVAVGPDGTTLYVTLRYTDSLAVVNLADSSKTLIKVGDSPRDVALTPDGKTAYVTNYDGTVSVIDTATKTQLAKLATGGPKYQPVGVAVSPTDGLAYVANGNDSLTVINTKTNTIVRTFGYESGYSGAHAIALGPDGRIYITDFRDDKLRALSLIRGDTAPLAVANPTVGSPNPDTGTVSGLVNIKDPDGDSLSFATLSGPSRGTVSYDATAGTYTYTPTVSARQQAAQGGPTTDTFTVRATEGSSGAFKDATVTVPISSLSALPASISSINVTNPTAVSFGGTQLYVANGATGVVSVINPATNTVTETTALYTEPPALSPDGARRYVAGEGPNGMKVDVIDTATGNLIDSVDVPTCFGCGYGNTLGIEELVVSADGSRVYARHDYATETEHFSAVTIIETTNYTVVDTKVFTGAFSDMEVTPNGTVYAAVETYPYVYRLDSDLNSLGTIPLTPTVGSIVWTQAMAMNANGTRGYVVVDDWDAPSYTYSVLDTNPASATYNKEIAMVAERTTALSPDGTRRYTLQPDGRTVVVSNTATNTVIGAFATDQNPGTGARAIAVASDGTLYIADAVDNKVYVVTV